MSIAETLKAAKAKLFHPVLNPDSGHEFICFAIEEVAPSADAEEAKCFLAQDMGISLTGSHFVKRVQRREDREDVVEGSRLAQQSARYTLLDAAIFIAEKRGV